MNAFSDQCVLCQMQLMQPEFYAEIQRMRMVDKRLWHEIAEIIQPWVQVLKRNFTVHFNDHVPVADRIDHLLLSRSLTVKKKPFIVKKKFDLAEKFEEIYMACERVYKAFSTFQEERDLVKLLDKDTVVVYKSLLSELRQMLSEIGKYKQSDELVKTVAQAMINTQVKVSLGAITISLERMVTDILPVVQDPKLANKAVGEFKHSLQAAFSESIDASLAVLSKKYSVQ